MVKLILPSERDITSLKDLQAQQRPTQPTQPKDYRKTVVLKPWGYEYLIFENELVAAWFLHIRGGHSTSMHCHPKKKTSLILLSGMALSYTFGQRNQLSAFEAVIIEKGVFHSTQSISTDGIDLIEVESPPSKTDLVRLQDKYGRESSGYEGLSEMVKTGLDKYRYFHFEENQKKTTSHITPSYEVSLEVINPPELKTRVNDFSIYCVCRNQIESSNGTILAHTGDAISANSLKSDSLTTNEAPTTVLRMAPKMAA